jgi:hypothetical protein
MRIKGVSGREYEEWKTPQELQMLQTAMNSQELERQNKSLKDTVAHLTTLIHTFGFCRPETQLARMELGEATERYVLNKNYDEKNLGVIARNLLKEMREKGELPDEN